MDQSRRARRTYEGSLPVTQTPYEEVLAFLLGEGPLDGVWFGDKHPTERGAFWWRKNLRALLSPPEPVTPGIAAHLPSAEWLSRKVATDPDVDCEASPVPTEPTEEEVAEAIGYYFGTLVSRNPQPDMSGDPRAKMQPHIRRQFDSAASEAAQAVKALFRSRRDG